VKSMDFGNCKTQEPPATSTKGDSKVAILSHRITIDARQDQVFEALSTLEGLKKWYTPIIDGTAGKNHEAVFRFADEKPFRWKFVEVKPNSLVRWECVEGPGAAAGTRVTFRVSWGILMGHLKKYAEAGHTEPAFR
jgi:uncharacterized membrane protein